MSQGGCNDKQMKFIQDMLEAYDKMDVSAVEYRCEICHIIVPDKDMIDRHARSTSHLMQLKKFWTDNMATSMNNGSDSESSEDFSHSYRKKKLSWNFDNSMGTSNNNGSDSESSVGAPSPDVFPHSSRKRKLSWNFDEDPRNFGGQD